MALGRSTAMGVVTSLGLGGVHSSIAAAEHELSLLRGHLRSGGASCRGADDDDQDPIDSWANQVRDVAFQLDDITDECRFLSGSGSGSGHGFARYCANVPTWIALSRRLRKLRREDDAVAAGRRMAENARSMDKEEIIGFSDHREVLVRWLLAEDAAEPRRRTLLAVCGMGGVGKTTLVASVYKEVTAPAAAPASHHFDCDAWVTVSQRFTMEDLLMKILRKLNLNTVGRRAGTGRRRRRSATDVGDGGGDTDYGSLVAALRERLANKRYLIVLDDVWDETLWDGLERAMPDGDGVAGSRVVITTCKSGVAMAAAPERTMALEPLPTHQGWALLCSVVFKDVPGHRCPSHLREVAGDMLERCRGLPLAIVAVGKLLRHKDRTEFAWRNVRDSLAWVKNSEDLGIGEASRILNLSIDDLPYKLKKCFLSCSIYPEDFLIKRKILIRSWVAQGFIDEAKEVHGERRTMEDVADHYLDKLVQRSLFQVAVRNEFGRAKRFLIHDLIKDLINHRLLTVLNLWFIEINKLPSTVTNLRNLRYLGIRSTFIEELPKDLGRLQKLQTLDTKWSMVQSQAGADEEPGVVRCGCKLCRCSVIVYIENEPPATLGDH
uniref:NBS-LRR-like resistance protein n=1 Tax=Oryza sativa TaxID=4530 RepID=A0A0U2RPP3_ORYSA|nr:NBS-LRR-like resistance protein [Oryza sativa]